MKNPFKNLYSYVENHILDRADYRTLKVHAAAKAGEAPSRLLNLEAVNMQKQTLQQWKLALMSATDPEYPDKTALERLYNNLLQDNHLASVIDSRILFCQRSAFKIVNEKGDENKELSWLFERTWFEDFIKFVLMSRFEGTKLIELFDLNPDTKELVQVDDIPMSFFNTKKGIIIKRSGDTTGWDYRCGAWSSYYIQVGKDNNLGMLSQMAPIILAKKLGIGSWLDYIEKYGVPALFITTDREDEGRLKELFQAGSNFKSSGFMVGRGQEKFEIGKETGGNADNFDKLIERSNSEISKRILGGSALTDERSFVGSTEIQFKLAKDRFESDKLLVKNVINQSLFPRLQKLSAVYSGLQNHYFEWDNTEVQSSEEIARFISVMAPHFELNTEEISQKTGFSILSQKKSAPPQQEIPEIKKKSLKDK